jgi:hypothetical protein
MFTKLLAATVFLFLGAIAGRANVVITAISGTSNLVLSATGGILDQGDLVRLGFFSSTANLGTDNSFSDLNSIFTPIGEGLVGSGTLSQSGNGGNTMDINYASGMGTFSGAFNGVSASYLPAGDQLFLWVFNSTDPNAATQWGIFDATSWTFPSNLGTANLSLSSPNITVFRGSVSGANFELGAIPAVPEPRAGPLIMGALVLGGACWKGKRPIFSKSYANNARGRLGPITLQ